MELVKFDALLRYVLSDQAGQINTENFEDQNSSVTWGVCGRGELGRLAPRPMNHGPSFMTENIHFLLVAKRWLGFSDKGSCTVDSFLKGVLLLF